jgi:cell division protein FtsW (lipid II flippase)/cell division protein FtsI/penicillin-binding protein 2
MPIYVSKAAARASAGAASRRRELIGLLLASLLLGFGAYRVYRAKAAHPEKPSFEQVEQQMAEKKIVALNELAGPQDLAPLLAAFSGAERRFAAEAIYEHARQSGFALPNVGDLYKLRVERARVVAAAQLPFFQERLQETLDGERAASLRREAALKSSALERMKAWLWRTEPQTPATFAPFAGGALVARLKPNLVVRRPEQFKSALLLWGGLLLAGFYAAHLVWRRAGFTGDQAFLPALLLLCGLGFLMMVSLRDPLRDTLSLRDFSLGVVIGCGGLILASLSERLPALKRLKELLRKRPGVPLAAALALSSLLIAFGGGPAGSDARVNLGPFQPVEFIKLLIVFYLAAYFDRHWEFLRLLKQRGAGVFALLSRFNAPRLVFFLPVMIAVGAALLFFFLQKDLGPALNLGATFLSLYAVARKRSGLIVGGLLILAAGLLGAYQLGEPATVVKRIDIFRDVWENGLRGGDQIAHSLWALSAGGATGTGLGLGDPGLIPAGHTDLILSSIGEELGFFGFALALALYALLISRSIRAALRAATDYQFFLALGLALITAWQILLIATGILGLFPLSGVVSPFLSWGKSSMIANFIIVGLILAVSATASGTASGANYSAPFRAPVKWLRLVLAALGLLVVGTAANYQIVRADETARKGALVELRDRSYQFQYNRRLTDAARKLKLGAIYDRHGVPLAASDCQELMAHRAALEGLGVKLDQLCQAPAARIYPFGDTLFHLLGDLNTRRNWAARNTNYVERDYASRLRGYDDHATAVKIEEVLDRRALAAAEQRRRAAAPPAIETAPDVEPDAGQDSSAEGDESGGEPQDEDDEGAKAEPEAQRYVIRRDLRELLPLLRHRYQPDHPAAQALLTKERSLRLSIDVRLQLKVSELLAARLKGAAVKRGAAVALDPATGDVLAAVSYPWPGMPATREAAQPGERPPPPDELVDRAFTALRPPGSTFKLVTAMAALNRAEADYRRQRFTCEPLGDGRVGKLIEGFNRPVRDSEGDRAHGTPDLEAAIVDSCNAYFAQLGVKLGAADMKAMADRCGIHIAGSVKELREGENLPQGAYGQGRVVATPFQMARVAAAVANGGRAPQGRWVTGESNRRTAPPAPLVPPDQAAFLLGAMRGVVTRGTARHFAASSMAGKTGAAQVMKRVRLSENGKPGFRDKSGKLIYIDPPSDDLPGEAGLRKAYRFVKQPPHGWFIGLAPFDAPRRIAFSVLIENGGYGGAVAAPVANELVAEARCLGLIP